MPAPEQTVYTAATYPTPATPAVAAALTLVPDPVTARGTPLPHARQPAKLMTHRVGKALVIHDELIAALQEALANDSAVGRAYTDSKIAQILGGVPPETLNTLKEFADYVAADQTQATAFLSAVTAAQTAAANAGSAIAAHVAQQGNPHGVTKSDVGLPDVENKTAAQILAGLTAAQVATSLGFSSAPAIIGQLRNGPINLQMISPTPLVERGAFGSGTDISPLLSEAGEYLRGRTGSRGVIEMPAGRYRAKTGVGDKLSGHLLRGQHETMTQIFYDPEGVAGILFNLDGADGAVGGWGGGGIEKMRLTLGNGPFTGAPLAIYLNCVNAGGTIVGPDQFRIEDIIINSETAAKRFYGGFHLDGTLRTSPQGIRVGNVRNLHIYDTSNYAAYVSAAIQVKFDNMGTYGTGNNDVHITGAINPDTGQPDPLKMSYGVAARHLRVNGALHLHNTVGLSIDATCGALNTSNVDYARGFIERGGAMTGAFGPKSSVVVMGP